MNLKPENNRLLLLFILILGLLAAFFYVKIEDFKDLTTNVINLKDSHPRKTIPYENFIDYLEQDRIGQVDLYEDGEIAVFEDKKPEAGEQGQKIGVQIPVKPSSLIVQLRESNIDFTAHPSINFDSAWSILSSLFIPFIVILVVFLVLQIVSFQAGDSDFFSNLTNQFMNVRKARAKVQLDADTGVLFEDVAGINEAKQEFEEFVTFLKMPQLFTAVGATPPKGVIIIGPPGTGKTLLAKAIAGEAGVPFISISGSEFVEMFVGIGASRVRDLFETAEKNSPCILFIDEIDAIGRQRGTGVGGSNDEREQTLNQILTEMDGFKPTSGIVVIAATNRADILDNALLRPGRFDRKIYVNLPDLYERMEILKVHGRDKKIDSKTSIRYIAQRTAGFSGADLANILNESAILTAREDRETISINQINTAIERIIAGLEGILLSDSRNKRLVAYHEVGHALTGTLLKNHDDVQKVTLIPRGQAQGLTWFTPEEQPLMTRGQLSSRLISTLAGRAAEEVIFGDTEITSGASGDFSQVNSLVRQMVTRFGMSNLTPMARLPKSVTFMGRIIQQTTDTNLADPIDKQIIEIVEYSLKQACNLLEKNHFILDQLAAKLIQIETIEGIDFAQFISIYINLPKQVEFQKISKNSNKIKDLNLI
ncbi:unnamed protein product [Discosporangium mesarthrocarpum]